MKSISGKNYLVNWNCLLALTFLFTGIAAGLTAQNAYQISVQLDHYKESKIYLYRYYGATPAKIDSALLTSDSLFVFEGDEKLRKGMYMVLLPPRNKAIQLFVDSTDQSFSLQADFKKLSSEHIHFKNSKENSLFYEYLRTISSHNKAAQEIKQYYQLASSEDQKTLYRQQLDSLNREVKGFQAAFAEHHPSSMTAMLAGLDRETPVPDFKGTDEEIRRKRYQFSRAHYFDHIDITDTSLLMIPLFIRKVDNYLSKMIPQEPDSVTAAIDSILLLLPKGESNYQYFLRHFLKTYEYPRYVGLDKVFVNLVDTYCTEENAGWLSESEVKRARKRAEQYRAILVGMTAPDVQLFKRDGSTLRLSEIESDYTVLFFWRPGCGHCKKARPYIIELYEKYKDKGVEILGLCTNLRNTTPECWTYIDEHHMDQWINVVDSNNQSRFIQKYNAGRTPKIYVLNRDKKILIKNFDASKLEEVMEKLLKEKE